LNPLLPRIICAKSGKNCPSGSGEKVYKWPHPIFTFLRLSPLWRRSGSLFEQLEFPSPRINLYQVWLILACWFWRRRFFKMFSVFLLFHYYMYLPMEKGYPLPLNKFEFPSSKDNLCQVWLKLVQWFWRKRFINDPTPFLHFCDYLPFEKNLALNLKKLKFPLPKGNLYQVWFNLACCFWRRRFFFFKFSVYFYSFAIISLWRGTIPFLWTNLNHLYPRMIFVKSG
jgi:hypothetical protein